MERQLPAGLSDAQRSALSEFFAGHISAGQLTQRLGIQAPAPTHDSSSERQSPAQQVHREVPRNRAARSPTPPRRRLAMRRYVAGLLSLAPRRTETRA
jgi:hypothetical protein